MLSANMRLQELNSGRKARVITALRMAKQHLFQYMGYIGAYLLVSYNLEQYYHLINRMNFFLYIFIV